MGQKDFALSKQLALQALAAEQTVSGSYQDDQLCIKRNIGVS